MTTEGLFIDDAIRNQPQHEWDIEAWTIKLIETFCPQYISPPASAASKERRSNPVRRPFNQNSSADRGSTAEELDGAIDGIKRCCYRDCFQLKRAGGSGARGVRMVCKSIRD